jgi:hypothetical protein
LLSVELEATSFIPRQREPGLGFAYRAGVKCGTARLEKSEVSEARPKMYRVADVELLGEGQIILILLGRDCHQAVSADRLMPGISEAMNEKPMRRAHIGLLLVDVAAKGGGHWLKLRIL